MEKTIIGTFQNHRSDAGAKNLMGVNVVKDLAGHKDLRITMGYANPDLGAQRLAVEQNRMLEQESNVTSVGLANWVIDES